MHALQFEAEQESQVVFRCTKCGEPIGFVKPGFGEPAAQLIDGAWHTPDNPDQWMAPCNELP